MRLLVLLVLLGIAPAAPAQTAPDSSAVHMTSAEKRVADILKEDGIHLVHFWAPWCDNSIAELRNGWYELVERHPDVSVTFVTIWNDGQSGRETMDRYGLPARVVELTQEDFGPSEDKALRRRSFLGVPVTWIPTTWVFRGNGELAFAFNYGELQMDQLDRAIADARSAWAHD